MATIQKGEKIYILVDDTAIECLTEVGFEGSADEIETTCKNTSGTKTFERGAKTYTFTASGNYTDGSTSNKDFYALWQAFEAGTEVTIKYGGVATGERYYTGSCKIMNLSTTSGNVGNLSTWTATFKVTSGTVTSATVV